MPASCRFATLCWDIYCRVNTTLPLESAHAGCVPFGWKCAVYVPLIWVTVESAEPLIVKLELVEGSVTTNVITDPPLVFPVAVQFP